MFRISCITRAINQAMRFARQLLRLPATGQTLCVSTASLLLSYRLEPGLLAQIDSAILVAQVECRVSGPVRLAYLPELLSSWAGPLLHYMAFSVPNAVIIKCDTPTCLRITKRCASSQRIGLQCSQALLYSWCARVPWVCHGKPDGAHRAEPLLAKRALNCVLIFEFPAKFWYVDISFVSCDDRQAPFMQHIASRCFADTCPKAASAG
jgi:hypothetical protein